MKPNSPKIMQASSSILTLKRSIASTTRRQKSSLSQRQTYRYCYQQYEQRFQPSPRLVGTCAHFIKYDDDEWYGHGHGRISDGSIQRYSSTAIARSDETSSVLDDDTVNDEKFRGDEDEVTAAHLQRFISLMGDQLENEKTLKSNDEECKDIKANNNSDLNLDFQNKQTNIKDVLESFDPKRPPSRNDLHALQLWHECESYRDTMLEAEEGLASARKRHDYTSIGKVKMHLMHWYTPLKAAIEAEQKAIINGDLGMESRQGYGPYLLTLKADKLAIIASHEAVGSILKAGGGAYDYGVQSNSTRTNRGGGKVLIQAALEIGDAIETEVAVERALHKKAEIRKKKHSGSNINTADGDVNDVKIHIDEDADKNITKLRQIGKPYSEGAFEQIFFSNQKGGKQKKMIKIKAKAKNILMTDDSWSNNMKLKIGCVLLHFLMNTAKIITNDDSNGEPAIIYQKVTNGRSKTLQGYVSVHKKLFEIAVEEGYEGIRPFATRYQPMIVPPNEYENYTTGCYKALQVHVMRFENSDLQRDAVRRAEFNDIYHGLNCLGKIPWSINRSILDVVQRCWDEGVVLGDLPSKKDFDVPSVPEDRPEKPPSYMKESSPEYVQYKEDMQNYIIAVSKFRKAVQRNMELRSLRCSLLLKLAQAKKFQEFKDIYFPFNLDFRGRVYPIPPHLNHLGSDLSRGILTFSKAKPLGDKGLYWLKVHLANLYGANKISFNERASFADENIEHIRESAEDPFAGSRWWMTCEEPFQALATCQEMVKAIDSGDPASYMCSLPVHMDGSCNGLQHYAALGLDRIGGMAVNLVSTKRPQDVYISVMDEVIKRVEKEATKATPFVANDNLSKDELKDLEKVRLAKMLTGKIDRGVVKRTVMTSVYGVTFIGARNQIKEKLIEKLEEAGMDVDELDAEIYKASGYLASVTMDVMGDLFQGARKTQNWLTQCARIISSTGHPVSWITPLGLPVIQPYRHKKLHAVRTILQRVSLSVSNDDLPVHKTRQASAFPPNYIHSLDASHMLLTAIEMNKRDLTFTAVHDSFWTHAADIDEMNGILRECFVDLYSRPLLQDLKKMWEMRFPGLEFPDIPEKGDMDVRCVKQSDYFFQ